MQPEAEPEAKPSSWRYNGFTCAAGTDVPDNSSTQQWQWGTGGTTAELAEVSFVPESGKSMNVAVRVVATIGRGIAIQTDCNDQASLDAAVTELRGLVGIIPSD